jgi:hypothetical protein
MSRPTMAVERDGRSSSEAPILWTEDDQGGYDGG